MKVLSWQRMVITVLALSQQEEEQEMDGKVISFRPYPGLMDTENG